MLDIIQSIINNETYIDYADDDELRRIADTIESLIDKKVDRTYLFGYTKEQFPFMGLDEVGDYLEGFLTCSSASRIISANEFLELAEFNVSSYSISVNQLL